MFYFPFIFYLELKFIILLYIYIYIYNLRLVHHSCAHVLKNQIFKNQSSKFHDSRLGFNRSSTTDSSLVSILVPLLAALDG